MDEVYRIKLEMYAKSILTNIWTSLTFFQNLLLDKIKQYIPHALFVKQDSWGPYILIVIFDQLKFCSLRKSPLQKPEYFWMKIYEDCIVAKYILCADPSL